jgi:hypothetical protein
MAVTVDLLAARREHQRRVEALLNELATRRRQLYRSMAAGVRQAGLRDAKRDLRVTRDDLRNLVDPQVLVRGLGPNLPRPRPMGQRCRA